MPSVNMSPEEMAKRIVRADTIQPKKRRFEASGGIPAQAMEKIAANTLYLYMAPEGKVGTTSQNPGTFGLPGLSVNVAMCPPGDGPLLHLHERTLETFFVLKGSFEITWGDHGQHKTVLNERDMISVPPNVMRTFRNHGTENAYLLVLVQGANEDLAADVQYAPQVGEDFEREFGKDVRARVEAMGWRFDAQLSSAQAAQA